ncbi:unnamed protein product [Sphagnum jensenii]|uniref:Uncharacterized protein n=1 Tax=Sphagnum jensenii TaxID=128206 RepID=A0ABP1C3H9_9BRYO
MADLFRQEVILCAESPLSLTDGFKKLQIRVHDRAMETRTEALATTTTYVSDPDQELRLVKICHILSGLAGGYACIAIPYNETTIYVICEDNSKETVQQAIKTLEKSLQMSLDETADDSLSAGIVLQSAIHFGLLSALFLRGWMALEKSLLLRNSLASYQDGQPVEAMSLTRLLTALVKWGTRLQLFCLNPYVNSWKMDVRFPSCCVLTRAGLMALPPSARASKVASVLENFTADAAGLHPEPVSVVISSHGLDVSRTTGWITAREALTPVSGVEDLQKLISPHNFRRPKPVILKPTLGRKSIVQCDEDIPTSAILRKLQSFTSTGNPQVPQNLNAVAQSPFFQKRSNVSRDIVVPESSTVGSMGTLKQTALKATNLKTSQPKSTEERETKFSKVASPKATDSEAERNLDLVSEMVAPAPRVVLPMSREQQDAANCANNKVPTKNHRARKEKNSLKVATSINVEGPLTLIPAVGTAEIVCDPLTSTDRQIKGSEDVYQPAAEANPTLHASQKPSRGPRATAADLDTSTIDIKVRCKHAEGKLMDLTVNELKCFLISQNVKASFRKKEDYMKSVHQLLT